MPEILKIKDLAQLLGVTRQTVHTMLNDGRITLPTVPALKQRRFYKADVDAWIKANRETSGPEV